MSDTESSSSAEKSIQNHIDKLDLYQSTSKHEKRLLRCVLDLSSFIAEQLKVDDKESFGQSFVHGLKITATQQTISLINLLQII